MRPIALLFCLAVPLLAQQGPLNLNFQDAGPGGEPTAWVSNPAPGYTVTTVDNCRTPGTRCLMARRQQESGSADRAYILQSFDAEALRGQQIRFRASVRLEARPFALAQLFVRVDRPSGAGFTSYTPVNAAASGDWTPLEIEGTIDPDAKRITIGMTFTGLGSVYLADAEFETTEN